jgi:hypothetical protein
MDTSIRQYHPNSLCGFFAPHVCERKIADSNHQIYFFDESIYICIVALTKISILCFYLRIFPKKSFRIAVYVVIALTTMYLIAFIIVSVLQCRPVNLAWLQWDGEHPGTCNNVNAQAWASAAINMFLDVLTMTLPLGELNKLSLSLRKKIMVMFMFCLGFLYVSFDLNSHVELLIT